MKHFIYEYLENDYLNKPISRRGKSLTLTIQRKHVTLMSHHSPQVMICYFGVGGPNWLCDSEVRKLINHCSRAERGLNLSCVLTF